MDVLIQSSSFHVSVFLKGKPRKSRFVGFLVNRFFKLWKNSDYII